MSPEKEVKKILDELGISVEVVKHPPALTTDQADSFIEGVEGVRTKTMFINDKKKSHFYLLIMDSDKRIDMDRFRDIVGANRVKFSSSDSLKEKMNLPPGVVSPFGLLNNEEKDIEVYIDREIMDEDRMSFHPNTNEITIFIETKDLIKFLNHFGYQVNVIDL